MRFRDPEVWIPAALLALGAALRLAWVLSGGRLRPIVQEMQRVAVSVATKGVVGDAYFVGQGPTTHVTPVMPLLGGAVYRAFGVATPAAEFVLVLLALGFFSFGALCFWRMFRKLGVPLIWRTGALAVAALFPFNFNTEVRELRLFDGALAVALLAYVLWRVVDLDDRPRLGWRPLVAPCIVAALAFLLSPPVGVGCILAIGLLTLRRAPWRQWPVVAAMGLLALVATVGPWAWRNEQVFHRPILTRGNMGLEMSIGFHDGLPAADEHRAFLARMHEVHPHVSAQVREEVARDGELAYFDKMKAQTSAWMSAHPAASAQLALHHWAEFWYPPRWFWTTFEPAPLVPLRQAFLWAYTALGLATLAVQTVRKRRGAYLYLAVALIALSLPYALVQPVLRYRYLVETACLFLAFEGLGLAWTFLRSRLGPAVAAATPADVEA
jgi:hypothetical protein